MSTYTDYLRDIEATPLDEMINGDCGAALSDAAETLRDAFLAMPAEQIIIACHHSHRLSDEVREAARALVALINEEARLQARQDREYDREEAAWERGWRKAGAQIALERAANQ